MLLLLTKKLLRGPGVAPADVRPMLSEPLTQAQRARNRRLSRVRATVEHPFLVVKRLWGHVRVRYRGIKKNLAQMNTLFGLANLYCVRYRLMNS